MCKYINGIIVVVVLIFASCSQRSENSFDEIAFQQGDLVFRKGTGAKSRAVLYADSLGIYSHVGIMVLTDSAFQIVHITPGERESGETFDKIKIEPINMFWRKDRARHGAVYRLIDNSLGEKAAQHALRLLEKEVLFDHKYQLEDSTQMYCTELVWYCYLQTGLDISFGKRSKVNAPMYSGTYIFPSDIYDNEEFVLIYKF